MNSDDLDPYDAESAVADPNEIEDDDCLHISYTAQAGGFLICDFCGEDVTVQFLDVKTFEVPA